MTSSHIHRPRTKVLCVLSEAIPYSKTGGLGDVGGSLPPALMAQGIDATTVLPLYQSSREHLQEYLVLAHALPVELPDKTWYFRVLSSLGPLGQRFLFLDNPELFDRSGIYQEDGHDYSDNGLRFGIYCKAVLEAVRQIPEVDADLFHVHDWQASFVPILRGTLYRNDPAIATRPVVLTIHNLGYQGLCDAWILDQLGLPAELYNPELLEFHGRINPLKGGILYSDVITTVSRRYAREIVSARWGAGLEGVLRKRRRHLIGIINGIDPQIWNPRADSLISETFHSEEIRGKATCRRDLQRRLKLPQDRGVLLLGFIGRMAEQKGIDLLLQAMEKLVQRHLQFVFLGTGDLELEARMHALQERWPGQVAGVCGYSEELAHRFAAGCDALVMPSLFEPCGLVQLYSQRYGTIPIVRNTGGLADTVIDATMENIQTGRATGFVFQHFSVPSLLSGIDRAIDLHHSEIWRDLARRGMKKDFTWNNSARRYAMMFRMVLRSQGGKPPRDPLEHPEVKVSSTKGLFLDWGPPLPARYENDSAHLCVQSHSLLYFYFEISSRTRDAHQRTSSAGLNLHVELFDLDSADRFGAALALDFGDYWFRVNPARRYQAELQLRNPLDGSIVWRLRSDAVRTPADRPSPRVHRDWMPVPIPAGTTPPHGLLGPRGEVTGLDMAIPAGGEPSEVVHWPAPPQRVPRHLRLGEGAAPVRAIPWVQYLLGERRIPLGPGDEQEGTSYVVRTEHHGSISFQVVSRRRREGDGKGPNSLGGRARPPRSESGGEA